MIVLRLTSSVDTFPEIPEEERSFRISARALEEASGEPVETIVRTVWPSEALPDIIENWIERYRPDFVLFWVNPHWFTRIDVPLPTRSNNRALRVAGRLAKRAGIKKQLAARAGRVRRRWLLWRLGGSEAFEPDAVVKLTETCLRRILRHEEVMPFVRGPMYPAVIVETRSAIARAEARRLVVDRGVNKICGELRIPYMRSTDGLGYLKRRLWASDGIHQNAVAHAEMGADEAQILIRAWRESRGLTAIEAGATASLRR